MDIIIMIITTAFTPSLSGFGVLSAGAARSSGGNPARGPGLRFGLSFGCCRPHAHEHAGASDEWRASGNATGLPKCAT